MTDAPQSDNSASPSPPNKDTQQPLIYTSAELLQGRREAWINHAGEMYRLRLTAQGKLYLTK